VTAGQFIDGPPPPSYDTLVHLARLELIAELEVQPGRWRELTDDDVAGLGGGIRFSWAVGNDYPCTNLELHHSADKRRWVRLKPTPVPPPRPARWVDVLAGAVIGAVVLGFPAAIVASALW